ncbi:MAG: hypothetical protein M3Y81_19655 [Chloroflexota bacterium]|nr:hypothetical protein [Chloroflexota bacterium]
MKVLVRLAVLAFILLVLFALFGTTLANFLRGVGGTASTTFNSATASIQAELIPASQSSSAHLQLKVQGLVPHADYFVTLHQDNCDAPRLLSVGQFSTDENGVSLDDFPVSLLNVDITQRSLWINIHQGGSASGTSLKCQQIDTSLFRHPVGSIPPAYVRQMFI